MLSEEGYTKAAKEALRHLAETFMHLSSEKRKVFISSFSKVNQLQEN
ncbi:hypothetical protein [Paenibacillus xylanilyticus]|uniref:Uncharacterized protein n=1 Tax=Paenibacillus xylanilyticus TaxID=248903 RepID=A0A7Y6ESP9_9BACL|nr:hypothetical protein [Paenibacillus xylanilyticus]NUU75157.1 hypothetical protein [Paenibacillus xylanilyticus]